MSNNNHWTTDDISSQEGRVVVITGANSGIGYDAARILAAKHAHVVIAGRNPEKCERAAMGIRTESPHCDLKVIPLDLADLDSVRSFANAFSANYNRLDILINNAGVMAIPQYQTADGFEMQFGTNHLGHFAVTGLLLDTIINTPNSRVVTISSNMHKRGAIDFDNLNAEKSYSKWGAYGQSKLTNLLFTYELQRRLTKSGAHTISVAAHPGYSATNLQSSESLLQTFMLKTMNIIMAQSSEMGALPSLYAAVSPDVKGCDYIGPDGFMESRGHPAKVRSSASSHDEATAKRLWEVSEQLTGVMYNGLS